jgi:hypothetical protein
MKNQYMFFSEQLFDNFDISSFTKVDTCIPNTNIHIYGFETNTEEDITVIDQAQKLDDLSQRMATCYTDTFQIISSESSQYFCRQLYPLVVSFETKLRYALYISRALYENGSVTQQSFQYEVEKQKKSIEEIDFGQIYDAIFTDNTLKNRLLKYYSSNLTKAELIKRIQTLDENTVWHNIVGTEYDFIEKHFLEIKDYRNHVMHNHLISFSDYQAAVNVLEKANAELDRAIQDKLIVNQSSYLNKVDIIDVVSGIIKFLGLAALKLNEAADSEYTKNIARALVEFYGKYSSSTATADSEDTIESDKLDADETENDNNGK